MHVREEAPAKINLSLLVGPLRVDGYHEVLSVFTPIDLRDELEFSLTLGPAKDRPGRIHLAYPGMDGEQNLVVRALRAVERASGRSIGGEVTVRKCVPVGAGLGGGSADAAVALRVAYKLLQEDAGVSLGTEVLRRLARSLGADVPFFLEGRPAIGRGIGDQLETVTLPPLDLVLVLSEKHLATPAVYAAFDRRVAPEPMEVFASRSSRAESKWRKLAAVWEGGGADAVRSARSVSRLLHNDLEAASFWFMPELAEAKRAVVAEGALGASMSGSGPTLFGVCASRGEAELARKRLEHRGYRATVANADVGPAGPRGSS
jgi:4-diphosphocytidyl-2-C-methyl-D-erythritol kinase